MRKNLCIVLLIGFGAAMLPANPASANLLSNAGFESPDASGGDAFGSDGWNAFGNAFTTAGEANNGSQSLKMFGTFSGGFGVTGAFQEFAAVPGDIFELQVASRHNSGDSLVGGGNFAVQKIVFKDAGDVEIGAVESTILDTNAPTDVWINNAPIQGVAPANTVQVESFILFLQPNNEGGAGFFDDAVFTQIPEPASLALMGLGGLALLRRRSQ